MCVISLCNFGNHTIAPNDSNCISLYNHCVQYFSIDLVLFLPWAMDGGGKLQKRKAFNFPGWLKPMLALQMAILASSPSAANPSQQHLLRIARQPDRIRCQSYVKRMADAPLTLLSSHSLSASRKLPGPARPTRKKAQRTATLKVCWPSSK